jgi:putative inorganic carbon (hco3(-)) transporter
MFGLAFFAVFASSLPLIVRAPFNGVLVWYVFSLGAFHTLASGFFSDLYYAYIIAILTCVSWMVSSTEKKKLPLTPLVVLTLLFMAWVTVTSLFALAPASDVWAKWANVEKMLSMCLVGFALTTSRQRVSQLIWAVVLSLGIWGVKGGILSLLRGGRDIHGPDGGMLAGNNEFGLGLVMLLPLLVYCWQTANSRAVRHGLTIMGLLIVVAVIFTYSRGALVGLCAMGSVFWLRSRTKVVTGVLILILAFTIYSAAPRTWLDRIGTIEGYEADESAMGRIDLWKVSLAIAEESPILGGGFRVTFWPAVTNRLLRDSDVPRLTKPWAVHSIYFDALSEHGWVGLVLFVMIGARAWLTCSWVIRSSKDRPEFDWANLLGRAGQGVLVGYWAAGSFASLAYLDEYWCALFILEAAGRLLAREIADPPRSVAIAPAQPLRTA